MTSFTECFETCFTLPREQSEGGSEHALEDNGCAGTTRAVCGGCDPEGEAVFSSVPGVWDLASDGDAMARAI